MMVQALDGGQYDPERLVDYYVLSTADGLTPVPGFLIVDGIFAEQQRGTHIKSRDAAFFHVKVAGCGHFVIVPFKDELADGSPCMSCQFHLSMLTDQKMMLHEAAIEARDLRTSLGFPGLDDDVPYSHWGWFAEKSQARYANDLEKVKARFYAMLTPSQAVRDLMEATVDAAATVLTENTDWRFWIGHRLGANQFWRVDFSIQADGPKQTATLERWIEVFKELNDARKEVIARVIPTQKAISPLEVMRRFLALGGQLEWDKGPYQWGPYQVQELAESAQKLLGSDGALTSCESLRLWMETATAKWEEVQSPRSAARWVWQRLEDPFIFEQFNKLLAKQEKKP